MLARLKPLLVAVATLALPATASAADRVVAPDPAARAVTALDGNLVWVSGGARNHVLMRRTPGGRIFRVETAPRAPFYRSIDLGRDRRNRLVLTYLRCFTPSRCRVVRDDLHGRRAAIRGLPGTRCELTTAPALWRSRAVFGQFCRTRGGRADNRRSGLYLKTGDRSPRRLPLPRDAVRFGSTTIGDVDVRGDRIGATAVDIFGYAFTLRAGRGRLDSFLGAASEGESDEHIAGLSLAPGGTLWALTDSAHAGDPNIAVIYRLVRGCLAFEPLVNPEGPDQTTGFRATDLAFDARTLYLLAPGTGIVAHDFAPAGPCRR